MSRLVCFHSLAQASVNAACMSLLWAYTFSAPKDHAGKPILPNSHPYDGYDGVSVTYVQGFQFHFVL